MNWVPLMMLSCFLRQCLKLSNRGVGVQAILW